MPRYSDVIWHQFLFDGMSIGVKPDPYVILAGLRNKKYASTVTAAERMEMKYRILFAISGDSPLWKGKPNEAEEHLDRVSEAIDTAKGFLKANLGARKKKQAQRALEVYERLFDFLNRNLKG